MVVCGICHEDDLTEIGELDSCHHSFCFECIQHWAQIESRCPFCKARFTVINRKELELAISANDEQTVDNVKQRLPGNVVETVQVSERNQVYLGDEEYAGDEGDDPLGDVMCMECGRGDDEDNLLLCDGCERACHTHCANLDALPEGDWFCWVCQENRHVDAEGNSTASATTTTGRPRTRLRSSLVASDFTLPRSRRRAASPGARSELARPGRRVRRRLVRSGQDPFLHRDQRQASDADMILNALERSISSRDYSGLSTNSEHRRLAGLRGTWNSVRQGQRPFPQPTTAGPPTQIPSEVPQDNSTECTAWAAFEQSRKDQDRATRRTARPGPPQQPTRADAGRAGPSGPAAPACSPPLRRQQTASSLARQAVAEARSRGRQLGPTGTPVVRHSSRPAAVAARDRIQQALPSRTSMHLRKPSTAPVLEQLASISHSHRAVSPPLRDDLARSSVTYSNRAPPAAGSSVTRSSRAVSPPVRDEIVRRQDHGSAGGHRGAGSWGLHAHTSSSQPVSQHRNSVSRQMPDQAPALQPWVTNDAVGGALPYSPALHALNPSLIPVHHHSFAQATMFGQAKADACWEDDMMADQANNIRQSPSVWQHRHHHQQQQQQQAQPQHQQQQLSQHQHQSSNPYQGLYQHQSQFLEHGEAPLQQSMQYGSAQMQPASSAGSLPAATVLQQQDTIDRGVLLNHELVKPLQECSCRHGASNGGDSSESSSSQIAPQQHGGVIDSIVSQQHTDRQEQSNVGKAHDTQQATQQTHVAQPPAKQPAEPLKVVPTKHEAFDLVRSVLKPLYASKLVSKEQFKAIAQSATHVLVDPIASAGRDVKHVVKDCLTSIGLSQAVLQV